MTIANSNDVETGDIIEILERKAPIDQPDGCDEGVEKTAPLTARDNNLNDEKDDHDGSVSTLTSMGATRKTFLQKNSWVGYCFDLCYGVFYLVMIPTLLILCFVVGVPLVLFVAPCLGIYYCCGKEPKSLQELFIGGELETDGGCEGEDIHQIAGQLIRRRCLGIMEYHKDANDEASDDESEVAVDLAWSRPIGGKAESVPRDFPGRIHWRLSQIVEGRTNVLSCLVFSEPMCGEVSVSSLKVDFNEEECVADHSTGRFAPMEESDGAGGGGRSLLESKGGASSFILQSTKQNQTDSALREGTNMAVETTNRDPPDGRLRQKPADVDERLDQTGHTQNQDHHKTPQPEQPRCEKGVGGLVDKPSPSRINKKHSMKRKKKKKVKSKKKGSEIEPSLNDDSREATLGSAPLSLHTDPTKDLWLFPRHALCGICSEPFQTDQVAVWSPYQQCSHTFHQSCILVDLLDNPECPLCKSAFIKTKHSGERHDGASSDDTVMAK